MSQPVRSTSWRRDDHDSTSGAGSLRSSRLRARVRSSRSFPRSGSSSSSGKLSDSGPIPSGSKPRRPVLKRVTADAQTSLTLDSSLVASSFTRNGQEADSETVTASLTSFNNFINFCATVDVPITNGKQLIGGSCNPAPMGLIPTSGNLPAVLINQPTKGTTIAANTTIPLEFFVNNLQSGVVVDVATNFLSAPQQLDSTGNILGHYHVVIEELDALNSTVPTDARNFAFFSVIKDAASNGEIVSEVTNGLPEGFYRMTATIHAANHQPVLVPIAQHGALIDVAYFTVTADGSEGSTPSVRRRAPPHVYTPHPSETQARRKVVTRADDAAQSSLSLLSSVIAPGFANDGQDIPQAGQSASLTSSNNFINFCATTTLPLTNGTQTKTGFCNPAPMGLLPASTRMPTSKFTYPRNGDILKTNAAMTIGLAITNLATGNFGNDVTNFLAAPQQLDSSGKIEGHPFIVFEKLPDDSFNAPNTLDFVLFKGLPGVADSTGVITTTISGLAAGFYRLSSIISATNAQPVLLPVLQHGAVDDAIYFVVADGGSLPTNQTAIFQATTSAPASITASGARESASASQSATATPTPVKVGTNIAAAVGGALAGITLIALGIVAIWLFIRRRNKAQETMISGYPTVLNSEDFSVPPPTPFTAGISADTNSSPSMTQIRSQPIAYSSVSASKISRGPSSNARRSSVASAAPSYHTQI